MCGGALLSARWALSAAHCTRTLPVATSSIVVGSVSRASGGASYGITRIVNHVAFDARTMDNDISLIESASTIVFSQSVQAVNIGSGSVGSGVSTTIVGFGQTSETGPLAENLQWITAPSISNNICRTRFSVSNAARVRDDHLCTQSPAGQG